MSKKSLCPSKKRGDDWDEFGRNKMLKSFEGIVFKGLY
jgi:hypothetical protein